MELLLRVSVGAMAGRMVVRAVVPVVWGQIMVGLAVLAEPQPLFLRVTRLQSLSGRFRVGFYILRAVAVADKTMWLEGLVAVRRQALTTAGAKTVRQTLAAEVGLPIRPQVRPWLGPAVPVL